MKHFEREAKLMLIFPGFIALVAVVATMLKFLMGGPFLDEAEAKRNILEKNAGCKLTEWMHGEGDGDHVYFNIALNCSDQGKDRRGEVLFQRRKGQWVLVWEKFQ